MKTLKLAWLNLTFYPLLLLYSVAAVLTLTLTVAVQVPFVSHRAAMRRFRRAISWYGLGVIRILPWPLVRVRYEGPASREHDGPFIVICNHRSASDPFLMACLPFEIVQVVNTWPFRLPLWGVTARLAGYLNIRGMPPDAFMDAAAQLLREGVSVVAFPEGTRSADLQMGPFHSALFRLALREKTPILPLCISGNERIPARGTLVLRPGLVRLRELPLVRWEQYRDQNAFQLKNRIRDMMARELATMDAES